MCHLCHLMCHLCHRMCHLMRHFAVSKAFGIATLIVFGGAAVGIGLGMNAIGITEVGAALSSQWAGVNSVYLAGVQSAVLMRRSVLSS